MAKTVLITGSSKGIGAATAILFAQKGYNVVINYNSSYENASLLCRSLVSNGYSVITQKADVSNRLEVELMVKETLYKFGSLDILVNNAGIAHQSLITDTDEIDFDRIIDVNLKGVFNCCKAVIPSMVSRQSGKIINISSMWGQVGASCESAYSAAKAPVGAAAAASSAAAIACNILFFIARLLDYPSIFYQKSAKRALPAPVRSPRCFARREAGAAAAGGGGFRAFPAAHRGRARRPS